MSEIEITVRGSFTAYAPAERATVRLHVQHDGSAASKALGETVRVSELVRAWLDPLYDPAAGPVTWWSSQQLHTWSHRPWNQDGKQLPRVYSARAEFEIKFSDFGEMGPWLAAVSDQAGVAVDGIEWALTAKRRESLVHEVRVSAVRDAVDKATSYASAFGLTSVRAIAIADAGMLSPAQPTGPAQAAMFSRAAADAGGAAPQFAPRDIAVTTEVDARFIVS